MALDYIDPKSDRNYHISFDIDALDRHEAPSTGYSRKHTFIHFPFSFETLFQKDSSINLIPCLLNNSSCRWFDAA